MAGVDKIFYIFMQDDYQASDDDNNTNTDLSPRQSLSRGQKIAAVGLAVFAVLAIGLWIAQFKKSISGQFAYKDSGESAETGALTEDENSAEVLRNKDTDNDGLSDWDELNVYRTSPYLEDSDSDGFSDKKEIDSNNDPNCPTGRDCYNVGVVEGDKAVTSEGEAGKSNDVSNELLKQLGGLNVGNSDVSGAPGEEELKNILGGQGDAASLRKMLLDAGTDANILKQISDADLIKAYQETLNK